MEISLSEGSLTYIWVFVLPSGPQNCDKKICNVQAPYRLKSMWFYELFPQLSSSGVTRIRICIIPPLPGTSRRGGASSGSFAFKGTDTETSCSEQGCLERMKRAVMFDPWVILTKACHRHVFKTPGNYFNFRKRGGIKGPPSPNCHHANPDLLQGHHV